MAYVATIPQFLICLSTKKHKMNIFVLCALLVSSIIYVSGGKGSEVSTTEKLTNLLDDITDFLMDILYSISTMIGLGKRKTSGNLPEMPSNKDVLKFTLRTIMSGYKMVQETIPVMKMARSAVESVSMVLPNVTLAKFVERIVNNLTPELIKNQ